MEQQSRPSPVRGGASRGVILLGFVAAFEIVIMISPFAAYFYAVFNPVLLALNRTAATRWLTAFFLPHMIVTPDALLTAVRIAGSWLFVGGAAAFLLCASQVYIGKAMKRGCVTGGLYRFVRHPQYAALVLAGLGLAIMWPRMLTLLLLSIMVVAYYVLARDEERRMIARDGDGYREYMAKTGMFFPRVAAQAGVEGRGGAARSWAGAGLVFFMLLAAGFGLRSYTVHSLPIRQIGNVDVLPITPDDSAEVTALMPAVLADSSVGAVLDRVSVDGNHRLLAYFLPVDYVMQGMIANTGDEWKLFEQHKTIWMIGDYIFHPFAHLTGGHAHHDMSGMQHGPEMYKMPMMQRRVIFLQVEGEGLAGPLDDFGINVRRTPLLFADVHMHTAEVMRVRQTPSGSGWGEVPTPLF